MSLEESDRRGGIGGEFVLIKEHSIILIQCRLVREK